MSRSREETRSERDTALVYSDSFNGADGVRRSSPSPRRGCSEDKISQAAQRKSLRVPPIGHRFLTAIYFRVYRNSDRGEVFRGRERERERTTAMVLH